jgi:hypothetical protein
MEVFSMIAYRLVRFYMPCYSRRGQKRRNVDAVFGRIGPNGSTSDQIEKIGYAILCDGIYDHKHVTEFYYYKNQMELWCRKFIKFRYTYCGLTIHEKEIYPCCANTLYQTIQNTSNLKTNLLIAHQYCTNVTVRTPSPCTRRMTLLFYMLVTSTQY